MNNNTHYPEDLGYKNGLDKALKTLREQRNMATEQLEHHTEEMQHYSRVANELEYNHHAQRRAFYLGQQEALLDVINATKRLLKNA